MIFGNDKKVEKEPSKLDMAIEAIIDELNDPDRELFDDKGNDLDAARIEKLQKLVEIKVQKEGPVEVKQKLNINTAVSVGGSLVIALLMLNYEKLGVITSPVKNFVFNLIPRVGK